MELQEFIDLVSSFEDDESVISNNFEKEKDNENMESFCIIM